MARPAKTAVVAKPAKSRATKPASEKEKKVRAHPPYSEMIREAIAALKERTGSSAIAIAKFVDDKQGKNLPANYKKLLSLQLKKLVAAGKLTKVKNSYKLSSPAKDAEKKPVAAKKEAPKRKRNAAAGDTKEKKPKKKAVVAAATKKTSVKKAPVKKTPVKKAPVKKVVKPKSIKSPAAKKMKK